MHELTGTLNAPSIDYTTGKVVLQIVCNEKQSALACYNELANEEKLSIKMGKYRERRSSDANAYCWVLIGKLAEKLNIPRDEIYRDAIKQIGGNYEVVCVQDAAVDKLRSSWSRNGLGWLTETMPSKLPGCTNVLLYYGSSTYDTAQMSRLINIVVDACREQGIETRTPDEIANMLSLWGENNGI
jgi:hypothetical protein